MTREIYKTGTMGHVDTMTAIVLHDYGTVSGHDIRAAVNITSEGVNEWSIWIVNANEFVKE